MLVDDLARAAIGVAETRAGNIKLSNVMDSKQMCILRQIMIL